MKDGVVCVTKLCGRGGGGGGGGGGGRKEERTGYRNKQEPHTKILHNHQFLGYFGHPNFRGIHVESSILSMVYDGFRSSTAQCPQQSVTSFYT